jgi:MerR family transcriptional regulator, light-induced transcriptional regulator
MKEENINFLTTRQLARMWQVSEATVKRWADAGSLHPTRTLGGHRRFALTEVLRFQNERGLDVNREGRKAVRVSALTAEHETADEREAAEHFFEAIVRGQEGKAAGVLLAAYMDGLPLIKILDITVTEAMRRIGELWHCGEVTVADEHLATQTATRAVETLRECIRRTQEGDNRRAIVCAVEDELHELSVLCVQLLLEERGWSVANLGANMPFFAMADAVKKHTPQLICISSTANTALSYNAREYEQFLAAAEGHNLQVVLGGEGFRDEDVRRRFPASLHADSFNDLMEFLQREQPGR